MDKSNYEVEMELVLDKHAIQMPGDSDLSNFFLVLNVVGTDISKRQRLTHDIANNPTSDQNQFEFKKIADNLLKEIEYELQLRADNPTLVTCSQCNGSGRVAGRALSVPPSAGKTKGKGTIYPSGPDGAS